MPSAEPKSENTCTFELADQLLIVCKVPVANLSHPLCSLQMGFESPLRPHWLFGRIDAQNVPNDVFVRCSISARVKKFKIEHQMYHVVTRQAT